MPKRDKKWWAPFSKGERAFIHYYESNANKSGANDGMLPDDCVECAVCGNPTTFSPCTNCTNKYEHILRKAE